MIIHLKNKLLNWRMLKSQLKTNKLRLKLWIADLKIINSLFIPKDESEEMLLKRGIDVADEFIEDLNTHIDFYRKLIN